MMRQDPLKLRKLLEPAVTALGYELVGVEYRPGGGDGLLRLYIDSEAGITLDDCERVSYQVSGLLDVEDPVRGHYRLEVSSPGLDRPLFGARDFERFAGREVKLRLLRAVDGRRRFTGLLQGLQGGRVVLVDRDGEERRLPLEEIESARLVPDV